MGTPTQVDVHVLAKGGKYLGDDIGGAFVTIRDAHTREILALSNTAGGSGETDLMTICLTRSEILPVDEASVFSATLNLDQPRLIKITAYGPLAAQQSANTVSVTQWVYPGNNITGGKNGGGFFLEIPGLIVQIINPPTHFLPQTAPTSIELPANVTMMCDCPIGPAHLPWLPALFEVNALVNGANNFNQVVPLSYDPNAPYGIPSQFVNNWQVPKNNSGNPEIYEINVSVFQELTGNTGVDKATLIIP